MKTKINIRKVLLALADVFIIIISGLITNFVLSLLGSISEEASRGLFYYIIIDLIMSAFALFVSGTYSKLWRYFNAKDYFVCGTAVFIGFALGYFVSWLLGIPQQLVFTLLYFMVAVIGILAFRFVFKRAFLDLTKYGKNENCQRTLIVGAGMAGTIILTELKNARFDENNPSRQFEPICFVDDDVTKLRQKIGGIPVVGVCKEIPEICAAPKMYRG